MVDKVKRILAGGLRPPQHLNGAAVAYAGVGLQIPLCIEYMFERQFIVEAEELGKIELCSRQTKLGNFELPLAIDVDTALSGKMAAEFLYLSKEVSSSSKVEFANWIIKQSDAAFLPFRSIFDNLKKVESI